MTGPFRVRPALPDDAAPFSECLLSCWREAYENLWGPERLADIDAELIVDQRRRDIEQGAANHVLAEQDGAVIGVAIAGPPRDSDAPTPLELYAIYVRSALQGSGIADDLLNAAIDGRPTSLWTYRDNPRASAFYVNHGFIPDGSERNDPAGILEIRMVRRNPAAV